MAINFRRMIGRDRDPEADTDAEADGESFSESINPLDAQLAALARSDPFGDTDEGPEAAGQGGLPPPADSTGTAPADPLFPPARAPRPAAPSATPAVPVPAPSAPAAIPTPAAEPAPGLTRRIGEILIATGATTAGQVRRALEHQSVAGGRRLGEMLVGAGIVAAADVEAALALQAGQAPESPTPAAGSGAGPARQSMPDILARMDVRPGHARAAMERGRLTGEPAPVILRDMGLFTAEEMALAIARFEGLGYLSAQDLEAVDFVALMDAGLRPETWAHMLPVGVEGEALIVAVSLPAGVEAAQKTWPSRRLQFRIAADEVLRDLWRRWFVPTGAWLDQALNRYLEQEAGGEVAPEALDGIIAALLRHACHQGASSIGLTYTGLTGVIRLQHDGVGELLRSVPRELVQRVVDKLAHASGLDNAARGIGRAPLRQPAPGEMAACQDLFARYAFRFERIEAISGATGRIHIHDRETIAGDLASLGLDELAEHTLARHMAAGSGLVLVTGPDGSGRSRAACALLREVDPIERAVHTIASVATARHGLWLQHELAASGAEQAAGYWLAECARAGAEAVLLGQVRDAETARALVEFIAGGRLAVAVVEAGDAMAAIARLRRLGVDRDALATQLRAVLTLRQARALCPRCRVEDTRAEVRADLSVNFLQALGPRPYRAAQQGCAACGHTGYRGTKLVYELLDVGQEVRKLIETDAPASRIGQTGVRPGYTLWDCGLKMVARGLISMDELKRVAAKSGE